jgi:hypothetical protein
MSTVLHLPASSHRAMPQAEQGIEPHDAVHQAKVAPLAEPLNISGGTSGACRRWLNRST